MDNVSNHMCEEVRKFIEDTGAVISCMTPYSPALSPIEYGFNMFKSHFKRNSKSHGPG